jgi:hypothetical protein
MVFRSWELLSPFPAFHITIPAPGRSRVLKIILFVESWGKKEENNRRGFQGPHKTMGQTAEVE